MAFVLAACLSRISSVRLRTWSAIGSLCLIGALGCLTVRQFDVWASDRAQHAYVAAHLTNAELLDDFTSRQLILEFLRGDEEAASRAVAAQLRRNPGSPGYRKAADIFAEKNRIGPYYGHVSFLAIMQEQMGLAFARKGELREANDHLEAALSLDERFYQAAYDRALVLLDLGRPNEALGSYLLSERWAAPSLTRTQSRVFLERLQRVSEAQGDARLASSAQGALRR
jgi:tetratricopeptide (TPR) repeat protein